MYRGHATVLTSVTRVKMITALDLTTVPKQEFSVAKASELYDDYIADHQQVPSVIYVKAYQQMILAGNGHLFGDRTWRGVPLQVR